MELKLGATQIVRPNPHSRVRFQFSTEGGIDVQVLNGYAFRQSQTLSIRDIREEPRIFYPLKQLERFYIYRPSDPYYIELTNALDTALQMLQQKTEGGLEYARRVFEGGQIAFDQIFPDDKPLLARLRELAKHLTSNPRELTNPSL
jgi:hypothetical protein